MTKVITVSAHNLEPSDWTELVDGVRKLVEVARSKPGGQTISASAYDSDAIPASQSL